MDSQKARTSLTMDNQSAHNDNSGVSSPVGGHCIYCLRSSTEVPFAREHVIPASLRGKLVLTNFVCKDHNDALGHQVDVELQRHLPVLHAFRNLGLKDDETRMIKNHFNVVGQTNDPDVGELRGAAVPGGFEMRPKYDLPDGSNIVPEKDFRKILRKQLSRDQQLDNRPPAFVDSLLKDAEARYDMAKPGDRIPIPELGRTLAKRSLEVKINLHGKRAANPHRAIAKIAYEFGFFALGGPFLASEPGMDDLWNILWDIETHPGRKIRLRWRFHAQESGFQTLPFHPSFSRGADHANRRRALWCNNLRGSTSWHGRIDV